MMLGDSGVGKSTLISVLQLDEYDDGDGELRQHVLKHRKELLTGSNIQTQHHILGFNS